MATAITPIAESPRGSEMEPQMVTAKQYRVKANVCGELSREAAEPGQIRKYQDSSDSFNSLADNEDWLARNVDKTLQASDKRQTSYGNFGSGEKCAPAPKTGT
jgi:hypothetical protein